MKYISITLLFLISTVVNGQCKKDTSVQYYDSSYQSFSKNHQVTVEFGTGSEISNNYNYISYESGALYCIIYGFDKKYEVKLFTNYSSIYNTSCSSISNIFSNGFVKGKDQDGRIWKIRKPSSQYNSNNNYNNRKYNKPTSSINHQRIGSTLDKMQSKIDYNRERVIKKSDEIKHRLKIIESKIIGIEKPESITSQLSQVKKNINECVDNADEYFARSNKSTLSLLSCLNSQLTNIEIIENNILNYSISINSRNKSFNINSVSRKNVSYCKIRKIFNNEEKTIIEFEYVSPYQNDGWINISPETYVYDKTNNEKLKLISVWNTAISPNEKVVPFNEKFIFQLTFEKLENTSKIIDIIECGKDSCFNFYGVNIN